MYCNVIRFTEQQKRVVQAEFRGHYHVKSLYGSFPNSPSIVKQFTWVLHMVKPLFSHCTMRFMRKHDLETSWDPRHLQSQISRIVWTQQGFQLPESLKKTASSAVWTKYIKRLMAMWTQLNTTTISLSNMQHISFNTEYVLSRMKGSSWRPTAVIDAFVLSRAL